MPILALPRQFARQQPRRIARPDLSRAINRGLKLFVIPHLGYINLVNGVPLTPVDTGHKPARSATRNGVMVSEGNGGNPGNTSWQQIIDAGRNYTVAAFGTMATASYTAFLEGFISAGNTAFTLRDWGILQGLQFNTTDGVAAGAPGSFSTEQLNRGALMLSSCYDDYAGNISNTTYLDLVSSVNNNFGTGRDLYRFKMWQSWRSYWAFHWVAVWSRVVPKSEANALAMFPWLICDAPAPRSIFLPSGGGPQIYEPSIPKDGLYFTDRFGQDQAKSLLDKMMLGDAASRGHAKSLLDKMMLGDTARKERELRVREGLLLKEATNLARQLARLYTDKLFLADTPEITKGRELAFRDGVFMMEPGLRKDLQKILGDKVLLGQAVDLLGPPSVETGDLERWVRQVKFTFH
jgi:hypothetical protein